MVYHNEDGSITSNAAPRTLIGDNAIIAAKDAEITRLRDAIEKAEQQADYGQIDACRRILSDALQRKAGE